MSCIVISNSRYIGPIEPHSARCEPAISPTSYRYAEPISISSEREASVVLTGRRQGGPIVIRSGLACTIPEARYLKVSPDVIWLLPENDFSKDVVVYANVEWRIE